MAIFDRVTEEQLEFLRKAYLNQGSPVAQRYPYMDPELMRPQEPSQEERAQIYKNSTRKIFMLGCVTSLVLAAAVPFNNVPFFAFTVILLASRAADILSTLFCLQMPWVYEANPRSDARRITPEFIIRHTSAILSFIGFTYLVDQLCPFLARAMLLAYSASSFVVTLSNFNQTFFMVRSGMGFYFFSNAAVGIGALFLLRSLLHVY